MNLRLAFVSSSSAECDHLQHAGLEVHVEEVLVPLEADQQRVAGVGLAGQGARRPPVVEHRDDPLHLDSGQYRSGLDHRYAAATDRVPHHVQPHRPSLAQRGEVQEVEVPDTDIIITTITIIIIITIILT